MIGPRGGGDGVGQPGEVQSPVQVGVNYRLVASHSGKAADINGASASAGATLIQWTVNTGLNQQFDSHRRSAHEWDFHKRSAHEWDFREGAGSKTADLFVAMKRASRRAGEAS